VQPKLVSRILNFDGSAAPTPETKPPRRVLKSETARLMREYMVNAASEEGTGRRAGIDDISLGVKTGTAQLINPATGAYSSTDFIASCIAVLPAEAPTLVLYHVIIKPKGVSYLGGRIAAPPIREAAEALVDYLGIPRGRNQQASHSGTVVMGAVDSPLKIGAVMPDFRGFSKRQLIPLLERQDLAIEIIGDGWVRRQYPDPGSPVAAGATLRFELE
jgi:cell division protein FtsI (penicillin-binding protein 3)